MAPGHGASGGHGRPPRASGRALPANGRADGPPVVWLAVAGGLELVALVLALLAEGRPVLSGLAWLLAGVGAIGALGTYTARATLRRATSDWYSAGPTPGRVWAALVIAAVLVVLLASYRFADWAARL